MSFLTLSKGAQTIFHEIGRYLSDNALNLTPGNQPGKNLRIGNRSTKVAPSACAILNPKVASCARRTNSSSIELISMSYAILRMIAVLILFVSYVKCHVTMMPEGTIDRLTVEHAVLNQRENSMLVSGIFGTPATGLIETSVFRSD